GDTPCNVGHRVRSMRRAEISPFEGEKQLDPQIARRNVAPVELRSQGDLLGKTPVLHRSPRSPPTVGLRDGLHADIAQTDHGEPPARLYDRRRRCQGLVAQEGKRICPATPRRHLPDVPNSPLEPTGKHLESTVQVRGDGWRRRRNEAVGRNALPTRPSNAP